jgi:hypothetical protein
MHGNNNNNNIILNIMNFLFNFAFTSLKKHVLLLFNDEYLPKIKFISHLIIIKITIFLFYKYFMSSIQFSQYII